MKPFNLELAKAGAKVCTAAGVPVELKLFDARACGGDMPVVGYIGNTEQFSYWKADGRWSPRSEGHIFDLFMVPATHKEWVLRWMDRNKLECSIQVFEEAANRFKDSIKRLGFNATVHEITVED